MLREIDPISVVGVAAAAAIAIFFHQWDRSLTESLKDPGMRTLVVKPSVPDAAPMRSLKESRPFAQ
jgi:hypothetical protein